MGELQVKWRGGFSDRNKLIDINKNIQTKDFDEMTRNSIFNMIANIFQIVNNSARKYDFVEYIYTNVFNKRISEIPRVYGYKHYSLEKSLRDIEDIVNYNSYHEVLTLIEAIVYIYKKLISSTSTLHEKFNSLFEYNCVGYRFINNQISPITDKTEIDAINEAANYQSKFANASKHIQNALEYLSDRKVKDYKASVHESISAIEATVNTILGTKETLNKALKEFEKKGYSIHPSLKLAFEKMYAYTSDKDGIRHDFGNDSQVDFEEAKYMLVSCSAFMNYLISVSSKIL